MQLQTTDTEGHILKEDLTRITTTAEEMREADVFAEMKRICDSHGGLGLAANQVGLRANVFYAASKAKLLRCPGGTLCINPSWEPHQRGKQYDAVGEGCLSLPGRRFTVRRWDKIRVVWTNTAGHKLSRTLSGTAAQVFQHEHDHLRGVTLEASGDELELRPL